MPKCTGRSPQAKVIGAAILAPYDQLAQLYGVSAEQQANHAQTDCLSLVKCQNTHTPQSSREETTTTA